MSGDVGESLGHCRHCIKDCDGSTTWAHEAPPSEVEMVEGRAICMSMTAWMAGFCPLCAEANEIAKEIAQLAHRCEVLENGPEMLTRGMRKARALVIARGMP